MNKQIITGLLLIYGLYCLWGFGNYKREVTITDVVASTSTPTTPSPTPEVDLGSDPTNDIAVRNEERAVVGTYTKEDIAIYIVDVFGYNEVGQTALAIAQCESGLDPNAVNEDNWLWGGQGVDHGIFQINDYHHKDKFDNIEQLYDPAFNIMLAKEIYESSGFWAWSCFKSGGYLLKL